MITIIKTITEGINEVLFPSICAVCGLRLSQNEHAVCSTCLSDKFELADLDGSQTSGSIILPEGVYLQHALWNFDKGGHLQHLLHQLKYSRLIGVGIDLGRQLGKTLALNPWFLKKYEDEEMLLVPVPLHPKKRRIRGYNQAYYIAKGLKEVVKLPIIEQQSVQRIKNTRTQTGFSLEKRRKNIDNAFLIADPKIIKNKCCVIVDDVFTTGATAFELAGNLTEHGAKEVIIATVAQA